MLIPCSGSTYVANSINPERPADSHRRWIYVVTAQFALYFNVFVLVVQAFEKVPALKALARTQSEAPFLIVQLFVLATFVALTIVASVSISSARHGRRRLERGVRPAPALPLYSLRLAAIDRIASRSHT